MNRIVLGLEVIPAQGWTGGAIYIRNLVATLATLPEGDRPEIRLIGANNPADPAIVELRQYPFVDADPRLRMQPGRLAQLARRVARRYLGTATRFDPLYAGLDVTYPTFGAAVAGVAPVYWLPDLQHKYLPHMFSAEELAARDRNLAKIADAPVTLALSSEAVRDDFRRFCPNAVASPVVWRFVSEPPSGDLDDPRPSYGLPQRYLYLPNQFWAHKNHITAFKALARLVADGHDLMLVCTGLEQDHRDPGHLGRLKAFIAENGLAERVKLLGLVPRARQIAIFRHATLVVQPSLFEGWSTVVEDAKALGRPIVASDIAVHREQLQPGMSVAPHDFFAATDETALAAAITRQWASLPAGPDTAAEVRAAALNAARQKAAAHEFMDILRNAIAARRACAV